MKASHERGSQLLGPVTVGVLGIVVWLTSGLSVLRIIVADATPPPATVDAAHPAPRTRAGIIAHREFRAPTRTMCQAGEKYRRGLSTSIVVICSSVTPASRSAGSTASWMCVKCQFGVATSRTPGGNQSMWQDASCASTIRSA